VRRKRDQTHVVAQPNGVAFLAADLNAGFGTNQLATAEMHKFAIAILSIAAICFSPAPARDRHTENRIHLSDSNASASLFSREGD